MTLNPDENLVELPSGAVAITRDGTEATGDTPEAVEPEGMQTPSILNDAELQLETAQYQVIQAQSETTEEVVAVIPQPWVLVSRTSIIPVIVEVLPDVAIPTEFELVYEYPHLEQRPEAIIGGIYGAGDSAGYASSGYNCIESPCGQFVVSEAVQYAKRWGKAERNPSYPDYGSNNCTNFLSQIMAHGGMAYMRPYENGEGSWWVKKYVSSKGNWFDKTESWALADVFPRHLWQYGLADIDSSNEPAGWQAGNILAEDWYGTNGKGELNHVQFVSGTQTPPGSSREPLIANSSAPESANYAARPWSEVKKRISEAHGDDWNRLSLVPKHRFAVWNQKGAKKHDPANLYTANGVFQP